MNSLLKTRILIVGDIMLDRYWFGDVNRISPEAPVPVVLIGKNEERLGGAANVARNVAALGAVCSLLGIVGKDEAGTAVEKLLSQSGITPYLHSAPGISTTVKLRVIGRQQQLLRLDFKKNRPVMYWKTNCKNTRLSCRHMTSSYCPTTEKELLIRSPA